jgi:hypothetical protein
LLQFGGESNFNTLSFCYDKKNERILKNIYTESPLTALAFRADCVTIAAGTLQGRYLLSFYTKFSNFYISGLTYLLIFNK